MGPPGLEPGTLELLFPPFNQLSYGPARTLYANPVLLLSDRTKLLYPGLRPLDVRQNIVGSRRCHVRVPQNLLDFRDVHGPLVQTCSESPSTCVPVAPISVDKLRNIAP